MPEIVNTTPLAIKSSFDEANDNRPIMVDVDHVSMIFNMASEQLNSIKEYMIALAKRELMFKEFRALDDVSFTVRKGEQTDQASLRCSRLSPVCLSRQKEHAR